MSRPSRCVGAVRTGALAVIAVCVAVLSGAPVQAAPACPPNPQGGPDTLTLDGGFAGSDLDFGWTGSAHNAPSIMHLTLCLKGCGGADTFCDVDGAASLAATGARLGAPTPVVSNGVATCVESSPTGAFVGTADLATGAIGVDVHLKSRIHLTDRTAACPVCSGATVGATGTCQGGARDGQPCVTQNVVDVAGVPYALSSSCRPSDDELLVELDEDLPLTTGTASRSGLCPSQLRPNPCGPANTVGSCGAACAPSPGTGIGQQCCDGNPARSCFGDTITRVGSAAVPTPGDAFPRGELATLVATACVPGTANTLVNGVSGLPGPLAAVLPVVATWSGGAAGPCASGLAGAPCALAPLADGSVCATGEPGGPLARVLAARAARAGTYVERAIALRDAGASANKVARKLGTAIRALRDVEKRLSRAIHRGDVGMPCADAIRAAVDALIVHLTS